MYQLTSQLLQQKREEVDSSNSIKTVHPIRTNLMQETFQHTLSELKTYQIAVEVGDHAWLVYQKLPKNFQYHIGNQFLDAADSIAANIAEGYGRYHYRDSIKFNLYARGSAFETQHWINQIEKRNLAEGIDFLHLNNKIEEVISKINGYNNYLRKRGGS